MHSLDHKGAKQICFSTLLEGFRHIFLAAIALQAPYVNSYRRYVKDLAAPINLEWARDNRTSGIRIPNSDPEAKRVENRIAGMDCNPYLGIAASLACGYLGIQQELRPSKSYKGDAYEGENSIPRLMGEALDLFDAADELRRS